MKTRQSLTLFIILTINIIQACQSDRDDKANKADLIQADIQFSELSVNEGMKRAFLQFADDSAVLLRQGGWPIIGSINLEQSFARLNDSGFTLSWEPMDAFMAEAGDMGYTYGTFTRLIKATGQKSRGSYVTIWKKQSDGSWKFVLDCGNEGLGE